jgi:murein DD-endopeptidase MepM/ murein hydrolase activator NlpD
MNAPDPQARRLPSVSSISRTLSLSRWLWIFLVVLGSMTVTDQALAARARAKPRPKPQGVTHVVERGQTLFRISQAYGVAVAALAEANQLKPSSPLKIGQRLFVPGAKAVKKVEPYRPLTTDERASLEESLRVPMTKPPPPLPVPPPPRPRVKTDAEFQWPLVGPINSPFGPRWGKFHAGLDIGSPHYQEVVAAADGEVIYAHDTAGPLGKAVVLQHGRGMRTVYAHLSVIVAQEGDTVRQGQAIGGVGNTGRSTGPHLHFEVRKNGAPLNPEDYLPATIDELVRDLTTSSR